MEKQTNLFEIAKQSLVLAPKTVKEQAFIYRTVADLENLIRFLGTSPKVVFEKGKLSYQFGKQVISDNSVITRNVYGNVVNCMTFAQANEKYDIAAQRDFDNAKDSQTPQAKPVKVKK
jgi:hypothetical protein